MRRGERVKLWEKQRPLGSLRELLLALNSLPNLGLPLRFMTPWDQVEFSPLALLLGVMPGFEIGIS